MAQQNEQIHSLDLVTVPAKRKRGRPRKEDNPESEPSGRARQRRKPPPTTTSHDLVGKHVSGVLDGVFDAGFLITVRVSNSGPLLKGMVFDTRLSVPITAANDVAPHIKMSERNEISIPSVPISTEPLRRRSEGAALRSKVSEAVTSGVQSTVSKEAVKIAGDQMQGLAGAYKLDSTSKTPPDNKTDGDLRADSTTQMSPRPPVSESNTKEEKLHDDSDQPRISIPAPATSSANLEMLQEIRTDPVGNGGIQMSPGDAA